MKGEISCKNCLEIIYKKKCKKLGFEYIAKIGNKIKCKCNKCGITSPFYSHALTKGKISCKNCLKIDYQIHCKKLGYKYMGHKNGIINAKCEEEKCKFINHFQSGDFLYNRVKCKCKKKIFVEGFIYRLSIGCYWYIGMTDCTIDIRYSCHITSCFNKRAKKETELRYNSKIYKTIREELCRITGKSIDKLTRNDFKEHVKKEQCGHVETNKKDLKVLETSMIDKKNEWCLNNF